MIYLKNEAIAFLNQELNLPVSGNEQDWHIELADSDRISDFINFYKSENIDSSVKYALMALILASLDDAVNAQTFDASNWESILKLLKCDYELHKTTINYWSLSNDLDSLNTFAITNLLRSAFIE